MGSWFSNFHIRKREGIDPEAVREYLNAYMMQMHYVSASSEEADGALAIIADEAHPWISVYSDLLEFEDPSDFAETASPISEAMKTDVLGIACFDSDYLYLNLINKAEKLDAWLGVGSAAGLGIKRRTGLAAWKKRVTDHERFTMAAKQKYDFAEEFLTEAEACLNLPPERSCASFEYLDDLDLKDQVQILWYKLPEDQKPKEPPVLTQWTSSLAPCWLDQPHCVMALNAGGESRGLSVYFIGPYVENDEITFSDVCFVQHKSHENRDTPIELTKVQLADGQWAYYYHDPGFRIPPKVDERLPVGKKFRMMMDREIVVRFIPHGNPRKILDITVVLVPDKNHAGQTGWNVWHSFGSKEAFVEFHNDSEMHHWGHFPKERQRPTIMKLEDFD